MADLNVKRILNFTEQTTLSPGDYAAIDSSGNGTKKFDLGSLLQPATSSKMGLMTAQDKADLAQNAEDVTDLKSGIDQLYGAVLLAVGTYENDGKTVANLSRRIRNENRIIAKSVVSITVPDAYDIWWFALDKNYNYISQATAWAKKITVGLLPTNTFFINFAIRKTATPNADISGDIPTLQNSITVTLSSDKYDPEIKQIQDTIGGKYSIIRLGAWASGGLTQGVFDSSVYYRLSTISPVYLADGLKFTVQAGRRAVVHTVSSDGTFISDSGWIAGGTTYTIPADTYVMMMLSPTTSTSAAELNYHASIEEYAPFATYVIASDFLSTNYSIAHYNTQNYINTGEGKTEKTIIKQDGSLYYNAGFGSNLYVTDYLLIADIIGNTVKSAESWTGAQVYPIAFYDINKNIIGTAYTPTSETGQVAVDIVINDDLLSNYFGAVYCVVGGNTTFGTEISTEEQSALYPPYNITAYPKILCCGDSVTYGFVVEGTQADPSQIYEGMPEQSYPSCIGRIYGNNIATVAQSGISVKGFFDAKYPSIDFTDYNLAIFELGLNPGNEGYLNITDWDSAGTSTYIYRQMIAGVRAQNSDIKIVLMRSPVHQDNALAVLQAIAQESDCIVIDLADTKYINLNDTKYHGWYDNSGTAAFDDTHYTRIGYAAKAYNIICWLGEYLPN